MNRPYYDQIGIEPVYSSEGVLENIYDDRDLEDTGKDVLEDDLQGEKE